MRKVLFVCMGNICRSPAAEGVLRRQATERGLGERVAIDSAGTIDYHAGAPPDRRMRRAAAARGLDIDGHQARQVRRADLDRFDLVVAMDRENLADLRELANGGGRAEVRLFSDFLPAGRPLDVPDPYYGGEAGFERVLDLLEEGCGVLLDHLAAGPGSDRPDQEAS